MANLKSVDESNFETMVLNATLPVLVDFWAPWCPPCRALAPVLEEMAAELTDRLQIVKVNIEDIQTLPDQYGVRNIPTLVLFRDGQEVARFVGSKNKKSLLRELEPHL
jgi:thioredoxin 1